MKAFCYINWDWSTKQEVWKDWGDCVISKNKFVKENYLQELDNEVYIHNMPAKEFLTEVHH